MKALIALGLAATVLAAPASATTLLAAVNGNLTESQPTPVPGSQHIDLSGGFTTYAASSDLPQITGGDLSQYSFDFMGVSTGYDDATRTATYSVSGTISGYGSVVQNFAPETLTVTFDPTFLTATVLGSLFSTGPVQPAGFPAGDIIDFTPANGAVISGLYTSNGTVGGGGKFNGSIAFDSAVPEPASWALMISGFGLVGAGMRRRSGRMVQAV